MENVEQKETEQATTGNRADFWWGDPPMDLDEWGEIQAVDDDVRELFELDEKRREVLRRMYERQKRYSLASTLQIVSLYFKY